MPEGAKYYSMFVLDFGRMDRKKRSNSGENYMATGEFIRKNGIAYKVIELWTDGI